MKGKDYEHDVSYFTLESTLCCYKSWSRPNRRYPNVYNDMMYNRIKKGEHFWERTFDMFWEARKECLPEFLRLEDNKGDYGLKPEKQNHYLNTGEVIMMDLDWPCFQNGYTKMCKLGQATGNGYKFKSDYKKENTIFPLCTMDRSKMKWEDSLYLQTPVQRIGDIYMKREDFYAPLGYGGINGAKLRQAIWLFSEYTKKVQGGKYLISGTSVKSPQLPMGSAVAEHFGYGSIHVIGATNPTSAFERDMVKMATWFGAEFDFIQVAYNPALKKRIRQILDKKRHEKDFYLEYGITLDHHLHTPQLIEAFHRIGAEQVKNIPDDIENIIIPSGSGNSTVSILYGLAIYKPKSLKKVFLVGIGPNKLDFIDERLEVITKESGVDCMIYTRNFRDNPEWHSENTFQEGYTYELIHHDLHKTGEVDYQDEVTFEYN